MSETKPGDIYKDSRGVEIQAGLTVAYNRSGEIAIGVIMSFRSHWRLAGVGLGTTRWWNIYFEMRISAEDGNISNIKNPNSFIIIQDYVR